MLFSIVLSFANVRFQALFRSVKEIIANNQHSFLDVSIGAVARLQQSHIYPIVVLIKFKSAKQLKEVNLWDPRAGLATQDTQLGVKDAKNLHEHSVGSIRNNISTIYLRLYIL